MYYGVFRKSEEHAWKMRLIRFLRSKEINIKKYTKLRDNDKQRD